MLTPGLSHSLRDVIEGLKMDLIDRKTYIILEQQLLSQALQRQKFHQHLTMCYHCPSCEAVTSRNMQQCQAIIQCWHKHYCEFSNLLVYWTHEITHRIWNFFREVQRLLLNSDEYEGFSREFLMESTSDETHQEECLGCKMAEEDSDDHDIFVKMDEGETESNELKEIEGEVGEEEKDQVTEEEKNQVTEEETEQVDERFEKFIPKVSYLCNVHETTITEKTLDLALESGESSVFKSQRLAFKSSSPSIKSLQQRFIRLGKKITHASEHLFPLLYDKHQHVGSFLIRFDSCPHWSKIWNFLSSIPFSRRLFFLELRNDLGSLDLLVRSPPQILTTNKRKRKKRNKKQAKIVNKILPSWTPNQELASIRVLLVLDRLWSCLPTIRRDMTLLGSSIMGMDPIGKDHNIHETKQFLHLWDDLPSDMDRCYFKFWPSPICQAILEGFLAKLQELKPFVIKCYQQFLKLNHVPSGDRRNLRPAGEVWDVIERCCRWKVFLVHFLDFCETQDLSMVCVFLRTMFKKFIDERKQPSFTPTLMQEFTQSWKQNKDPRCQNYGKYECKCKNTFCSVREMTPIMNHLWDTAIAHVDGSLEWEIYRQKERYQTATEVVCLTLYLSSKNSRCKE